MIDAHICFDHVPEPDIISWNVCIAGYSGVANYRRPFSVFQRSKLEGIIADEITFISDAHTLVAVWKPSFTLNP